MYENTHTHTHTRSKDKAKHSVQSIILNNVN